MAVTDLVLAEIVISCDVANEGGDRDKSPHNVYHFFRDGTVNPWSGSAILDAFASSIGAATKTALSEDATNFQLAMRNVNDATSAYFVQSMTGDGAVADERETSFSSVCIHLLSGMRGRRYRGRKHYSPIANSSVDGDVLSTEGATNFAALGAAILAGFTDADGNLWKPAVLSTSNSTIDENPTSLSYVPVTSIKVTQEIGIMKRRHS